MNYQDFIFLYIQDKRLKQMGKEKSGWQFSPKFKTKMLTLDPLINKLHTYSDINSYMKPAFSF